MNYTHTHLQNKLSAKEVKELAIKKGALPSSVTTKREAIDWILKHNDDGTRKEQLEESPDMDWGRDVINEPDDDLVEAQDKTNKSLDRLEKKGYVEGIIPAREDLFCGDCEYYDNNLPKNNMGCTNVPLTDGMCRRYPPVLVVIQTGQLTKSMFARVHSEFKACGEFKFKVE